MQRGRAREGLIGLAPGQLSAVLREVRRSRGRSAQAVARAMDLPLRTYQAFEAGHETLQVERIFQFAAALDVDPYAVLLAVMLDVPPLAVSCADNKLALALMLELKAFQDRAGPSVANLRASQVIHACRAMFDALGQEAEDEREAARDLLRRIGS